MNDKYILDGKTPVICEDLMTWAKWYEKADRVVKRTELPGNILVSTIFLGLDHSFFTDPPKLFETMIFGGEQEGYQERYSTWEEAERGHEQAIKLVFA